MNFQTPSQVLLYGTFRDKQTGDPVVSQAMLAEIEGKQAELLAGCYSGIDFLNRFSLDVLPIMCADYCFMEGRARAIQSFTLDPEIALAHKNDLSVSWTPKGRVYFTTGRALTRLRQTAIREQDQQAALSRLCEARSEEARVLLEYLNRRAPNRFTTALRHLDEAVLIAWRIEDEAVMIQQLRILRHIASQPVPFYAPTAHSPRIFPFEQQIASLKRNVRHVLTQDWYGVDLKSAQFAICASEWQIEPIQAFLRDQGDIWSSLFAHFRWDDNKDLKPIFKQAVYTTIFGGGKKRIRTIFTKSGLRVEDANHFLSHPLIMAMWKARSAQLQQIKRDSGAYDCFGTWIDIRSGKDHDPNARSVLAQLAQALELKLMYPIVELARQTDEFDIVLWLHDGCYLDFKNPTKAERWKRRITDAVNAQAAAMGIYTWLVRK